MNVTEAIDFTSAAPGPLTLKGGRYALACIGSAFGTVAWQGKLADGTFATMPDVAGVAISFAANGWRLVDLTPGQYQIAIVTTTGVKCRAASVPT